MLSPVHIVVDAMGGDQGLRPSVSASVQFLRDNPSVSLSLIGDEPLIESYLSDIRPRVGARLHIVHAPQAVTMGDKPGVALRKKRDSSMAVSVQMVADGKADACVSAGNTGALLAFGVLSLRTLPGIERPAICKAIPTAKGRCFLLDLGANLECSAGNLLQFALMGAAMAHMCGVSRPRVGVLNVGTEAQKGRLLQQKAAQLIAEVAEINAVGFVEGDDIYRGDVDVVVCDGFTGNIVLKASEGAVKLLQHSLKDAFLRTPWARCVSVIAGSVLRRWRNRYDPSRYNGAAFLGLNGVLVKSHGSASIEGYYAALDVAYEQVKTGVPARIARAISRSQ